MNDSRSLQKDPMSDRKHADRLGSILVGERGERRHRQRGVRERRLTLLQVALEPADGDPREPVPCA